MASMTVILLFFAFKISSAESTHSTPFLHLAKLAAICEQIYLNDLVAELALVEC